MSTQRKEIVQVMQSDPARAWSYEELSAALPHIATNAIRSQVSRLVKANAVARDDAGLLRATSATQAQHGSATRATPTGTDATSATQAQRATAVHPPNAPESARVAPVARVADARPPVPLSEHDAYVSVMDALASPALVSTFRLATALAFVRAYLRDCKAPAIATCGRAGTGKTVMFEALSILLHGDKDAVLDARNLTSKQQVIGRREKVDGTYVATPSVLFAPPDRPAPALVVLDEVGEKLNPDVLRGLGMILKLEPHYYIEGTKLDITALVAFAFNKPKGTRLGAPWTPFQWEGAARRMLVCDLDYDSTRLKAGVAKASARRVFAALDKHSDAIDLSRYVPLVKYPSTALLEGNDEVLREVFVDASELPLGDPVLRGVTAAYGALYGLPTDRALLSVISDVASIVGTLPGLLKDDADKKLNTRLKTAGLPTIALPTFEATEDEGGSDNDPMSLSPAARARIASHLARASTKGLDELLTTLCEYNLAKRERRYIRVPRWLIEITLRWLVVLVFGVFAALWNVGLSRLLKLPRISGGVIYSVFGFAAKGPRTQLIEYVDRDGKPIRAPRDYVLRLFGDDLTAREAVEIEDASKETEELKNAA